MKAISIIKAIIKFIKLLIHDSSQKLKNLSKLETNEQYNFYISTLSFMYRLDTILYVDNFMRLKSVFAEI